ncbi:sanguinarine reductase isoform X1 [Prunus yedoensis var. nudiflora]|uniref:Sanguinarine reductase isoform X1 n=1 Tax=Prunus yedoensis var. nudiflora TaxID=2094558 RepID=A0A314XJM2_PRUYE|nr:sanguinarine reductase isoform X1 [Prunus yedoensis var. nudiflora]
MASRLSLISIPNLPTPARTFPKHPQQIPLSSLPPIVFNSSGGSSPALHAVQEEVIPSTSSDSTSDSKTAPSSSSKVVLVIGGTGGVGQLVVASLLNRNIKARLLLRDPEKATMLFGEQDEKNCRLVEGVRNLVSVLPSSLQRVVLVSSVGVTKFNELPWSIMNLFGVLKYKKMGEDILRNSGLSFTIIRPGRLTDGPYTSYDLNTLLKATAGQRRAVLIGQGDKLVGEVSRLVVAEACIQALDIECTEGKTFEV